MRFENRLDLGQKNALNMTFGMRVYIRSYSCKLRSSRPVLCKKVFLEISQENTCDRACNFIKKETLAQVSSCEFCEISKNNFSHRTPLVAASVKVVSYLQFFMQTLLECSANFKLLPTVVLNNLFGLFFQDLFIANF